MIPSKRRFLIVSLLLLLGLVFVAEIAPLLAQDASAPAAGDGSTSAPPAPKEINLYTLLQQGGVVMYPLGGAWILVFYFLYDGVMSFRAGKLAPAPIIAKIKEAFSNGNYQEAWSICQANKSFLSSILGSGLERIGRGKDAVDFAVEEAALRESTILKQNITYLSVIGVVSPMIGLTGTVIGMIGAFRTLAGSGIANPAELAGHIGEVLVATASGLIVAIPGFVFFYILKNRAQSAILVAESKIYRLLDDIPYEQLSGIRIGEDFSPMGMGSVSPRKDKLMTSQRVSRALTTNCPACNSPISVGVSPCPNCQTVLDWGS